jgi:LacI family transcriptional regulator
MGDGPNATPTIYDVAEHAGVSIATVSRVLNGYDYLRAETKERVMEAVQTLGFVPNGPARQLSNRAKKVIALAFVRPSPSALAIEEESLLFTDAVVRGAELAAQRHGYSLLLAGLSENDSEHEVTSLTGKADGLIVLDRVLPERRVAPLAKRSPLVLLAGTGRSRSAMTVRVDNTSGMQALAEHLVVTHGYRRLAFMAGKVNSPDSAVRARAFVQAAASLGARCEPIEPWRADYSSSSAVRTIHDRLESGEPLPQSIACANDQMAVGVMHALHLHGIHVPDDVTVAGFDDIPVARHLNPALTTVRQPSQQLGSVAAQTLIELIGGRDDPVTDTVLPTQLMVRRSCGCDYAPLPLDP